MKYLQLFFAFLQIGLVAFGGGYAALPIIQDVIVGQYGWLNMTEMLDVVTISQLTPGPIAINAASFVGTKLGAIPGAAIATFGNIIPQTLLMLTLGYFLFRGKRIVLLDNMLEALRPGVVGLIAVAALSMLISSVYPDKTIDFIALGCFGIGLVLYYKKVDVMILIGLGAIIGIVSTFLSIA